MSAIGVILLVVGLGLMLVGRSGRQIGRRLNTSDAEAGTRCRLDQCPMMLLATVRLRGIVHDWSILFLLVIGLVAGFLARLLVPGPDPMGVGQTILLGIVGSFIGASSGTLFHKDGRDGAFQPSGRLGRRCGDRPPLWRAYQNRTHRPLHR
jgi:uncharacterized membrane protein YeaQ/YmgE (transglycosylase-associated protein family)